MGNYNDKGVEVKLLLTDLLSPLQLAVKLVLPFSIGGSVDLYRFREYISDRYPNGVFEIVEDFLILKLPIAGGEIVAKAEFDISLWLLSSGMGLFIINLSSNIDEALTQRKRFLYQEWEMAVNNQKMKRSIYSLAIDFLLAVFHLRRLEDARMLYHRSRLKDEVSSSGIDFLLTGKEELFLGFSYQVYLILRDKIAEGRYIFFASSDEEERRILFFLLLTTFYNRLVFFTIAWVRGLKKDILNLREGLKVKGTIGWEWARDELEAKRLNFLDFLSYYRYHDCHYSTQDIPSSIMEQLNLKTYIKKIEENIATAQFLIEEIARLVAEKQGQTFTHHTRRLEYLITILGALGGIAAILAAIFGGNISFPLRFLAIHLRGIEREQLSGATASAIVDLYRTMIADKEIEIENLRKEIKNR